MAIQARPNLVRRDTDQILSYYQSEHAGRSYEVNEDYASPSQLRRRDSSRSNTPSEYSTDSGHSDKAQSTQPAPSMHRRHEPVIESRHTRRPSVPSEGGSDRRRLAIVEMDSTSLMSISHKHSGIRNETVDSTDPSNGLLSRRGLHVNGLALVAPPDASPRTYTDLTPPPSAPIVVERTAELQPSGSRHQRSASEAVHSGVQGHLHRKTSRDVGIVGTGGMYAIQERHGSSSQRREVYDGLKAPIFQTPAKSRSSSPAIHTPDLSDSATSSFHESYHATPASGTFRVLHQPLTPEIGEGKDIKQPVVGPVVLGLNSEEVMRRPTGLPAAHLSPSLSASPPAPSPMPSYPLSPYIYYEPGVHATAGPLPPPPQSIFDADRQSGPPPRPPRLRTPAPLSSSPMGPRSDIEVLKESLQLPRSVTAVLASRSNSRLDVTRHNSDASDKSHYTDAEENDEKIEGVGQTHGVERSKSLHRREGAFPPSSSSMTPSTVESPLMTPFVEPENDLPGETTVYPHSTPVIQDVQLSEVATDVASVSSRGEDSSRQLGTELRRQSSWISLRLEASRSASPNGGSQYSTHRRSMSPSPSTGPQFPLPPPKTGKGGYEDGRSLSGGSTNPFKATLSNLKRFSALPRTPSSLSTGQSTTSRPHSRTPSPLYASVPRLSPRPRIKARWPAALQCSDVVVRKSALERSRGYAEKINELAMYDCGLSDWVMSMKFRGAVASLTTPEKFSAANASIPGNGSRPNGALLTATPAAPSTISFSPQPRHTSHGSTVSEATFPTRSDAYTATDLSMRPIDDLSSTKAPPPTLPYPSLATAIRSPPLRSSTLAMSSSSSQRYQIHLSSSNSKPGFFASIGRKASLKKDRSLVMSPPSPSKVLTKRLPNSHSNPNPPRPVQLTNSPAVPGGPRAVPGRVQRSQTMSVAPVLNSQPESHDTLRRNSHRQSVSSRRPSIFTRSASVVPPSKLQNPSTNLEFEMQVDKLADLLPHVERPVLAGYLRRAGQDILAIGQYLEDEKNGTIRRD